MLKMDLALFLNLFRGMMEKYGFVSIYKRPKWQPEFRTWRVPGWPNWKQQDRILSWNIGTARAAVRLSATADHKAGRREPRWRNASSGPFSVYLGPHSLIYTCTYRLCPQPHIRVAFGICFALISNNEEPLETELCIAVHGLKGETWCEKPSHFSFKSVRRAAAVASLNSAENWSFSLPSAPGCASPLRDLGEGLWLGFQLVLPWTSYVGSGPLVTSPIPAGTCPAY